MIWATVSSWSSFCWPYRASPSLAAKNIINLISILTIWWFPCVESSLVLLEEGVCYDQCIFLTKLLVFALLHSVLQGQICLLLQVFLETFFWKYVWLAEKKEKTTYLSEKKKTSWSSLMKLFNYFRRRFALSILDHSYCITTARSF